MKATLDVREIISKIRYDVLGGNTVLSPANFFAPDTTEEIAKKAYRSMFEAYCDACRDLSALIDLLKLIEDNK